MPITTPDVSSYTALSKRIVQSGVLPGPRLTVPPAAALTDQGAPDMFLPAIPFIAVGTEEPATNFRVRRVAAPSAGTNPMKAASFQPMTGTTTTSAFAAFDIQTQDRDFKKISIAVYIDPVLAISGAADSALDAEIETAKVSLLWALGDKLLNGNSGGTDPNEMDGLITVADSSFTITSSAGDGNTTTEQQALLDEVSKLRSRAITSHPPVASGPDAFVTCERAVRRLIQAEQMLGLTPQFRECPLVGGLPCYYLYGLPVLSAPVTEKDDDVADRASIYAVELRGPAGLKVAHLGGKSSDLGIVVTRLPYDGGTGAYGAIVQGYYTLVAPEKRSVVRLQSVDISLYTV